jgi:YgiT-type zinc finger domain-containing protein
MKCAICGSNAKIGKTTVSVDTGTGVVVVRGVPAYVCGHCGEDWLTDDSAEQVEKIVARARKGGSQIEVVALAPA